MPRTKAPTTVAPTLEPPVTVPPPVVAPVIAGISSNETAASGLLPIPPVEDPEDAGALGEKHIDAGAKVVIEGLAKCPEFNGASGVVQSMDSDTGRYNVVLDTGKLAKIKALNLQIISNPPACVESRVPESTSKDTHTLTLTVLV